MSDVLFAMQSIVERYEELPLTDEQQSMLATAFLAGLQDSRFSLCCAPDALAACAAIVGTKFAAALHAFAYESLGCGVRFVDGFIDEDYYLEKIADFGIPHGMRHVVDVENEGSR